MNNNNPGGFDPKKQQGKTVTIFSTKKNTYDMPGFERAPSPYQNYMQPPPSSSNFMPRTQDVAGSRGIFQSRKDYFRDETFNYSARGNPGFEESSRASTPSSYKQVFQDFMNNEFKSQIIQFRFEMTQIMDVSLRDFYEKSSKDQELFQAIKESVNHHTHQVEELEHKLGEFSANLGSVGSFKSFGEESSKMLNAQKMQRIEYQQQEVMRNFDRLKEEVEESLQASLEDYDQDTYKKTSKVVSEIKAHMEEKIEKVFEHLNGKVTVLEKQIRDSSLIDDKIKEDITEKFNSHLQRNQEQIESSKWAVGNKADEIFLKNNIASFGLDRKIDQAKFELESITAEIALVAEKIKQENMALSNKAVDLENKYYDQCLQYKSSSSAFDLSLSPSKRSNSVDNERKVAEIEKEFEEIKIDQRDLGNNILVQKLQLEKSRPSSPKMFDPQSEEAYLRKLEEMIDGLSENVETLRKRTVLQETPKARDKTLNPLYSSQKIESSPLSRELEKSSPGSRMRRLSIHSSNSSPGGHVRGEEPMSKSSINLDQKKAHSTHSSPGVARNSNSKEVESTTTIVIHSVTDQKLETSSNVKPEKPATEAEDEDDDDEIEVVLQIDDDGYLLDENGNYYFDKNGDKIKLDEKQIERLRHHNLIEEEEDS